MQLELFVPDRFDVLQRKASSQLNSIVVPVNKSLNHIDFMFADMTAAGRGAFLILRGESGSGKSTFLHTVELFRENVRTYSIQLGENIVEALNAISKHIEKLRIIVIEGKEALKDSSRQEIENIVHAVNTFLRSHKGENTIIVWPCNTDDMQGILLDVARSVGGSSLIDNSEPVHIFTGPERDNFIHIAEKTVSTLNDGACLYDLGISNERAKDLVSMHNTIGDYLKDIRKELLVNKNNVEKLLAKEQCRMWVVVAAGNDPDNDVAALTKGSLSHADIDKLMSATEANIVSDLKQYPEKLGILSAVLDAKIIHLPVSTILAIIRQYADDKLREIMIAKLLSTAKDPAADTKLLDTDLSRAFNGSKTGTRTRGKIGSNTTDAFQKLTSIAKDNDVILNRALGNALVAVNLIDSFELEKDLGKGLTRRTDIVCKKDSLTIRLEMMWRAKTGRADVANYTLTKLYNYGRAIELLG